MLECFRAGWKRIINPIAILCVRVGISANTVTVVGSLLTIIVAVITGVTGWMFVGAFVLTILVLFDSLDGSVAALTNGGTKFGAFLDSTLDRIADWALLVAVMLFFIMHADWWHDAADTSIDYVAMIGMGAALVSIMTSFVTSYARARAESVGYEVKVGVATRADRLAIILIGMAVTGLAHHGVWLCIAMVLLAVLGVITVAQRIGQAYRLMMGDRA